MKNTGTRMMQALYHCLVQFREAYPSQQIKQSERSLVHCQLDKLLRLACKMRCFLLETGIDYEGLNVRVFEENFKYAVQFAVAEISLYLYRTGKCDIDYFNCWGEFLVC